MIIIIALIVVVIIGFSIWYFMFRGSDEEVTTESAESTESSEASEPVKETPSCGEGEEWNSAENACKRILPTEWTCLDGIGVPLRLNAENDVECMSHNDKDCLWAAMDVCQTTLSTNKDKPELKPLACGAEHTKHWGGPGYDNPEHWCAKAKAKL